MFLYNIANRMAVHQICGFCRYWDTKNGVSIPSENEHSIMYAPCKRDYESRLTSANHCEKPSLRQEKLVFRRDDACCAHDYGFRVSLSCLKSSSGLLVRVREAVHAAMAREAA